MQILAVDSTVERTIVTFKTPRWNPGYEKVLLTSTGSTASIVLSFVDAAAPSLESLAPMFGYSTGFPVSLTVAGFLGTVLAVRVESVAVAATVVSEGGVTTVSFVAPAGTVGDKVRT